MVNYFSIELIGLAREECQQETPCTLSSIIRKIMPCEYKDGFFFWAEWISLGFHSTDVNSMLLNYIHES